MPRLTATEQLAACRAHTYRLTRLLVEHDIEVPPADPTVTAVAEPGLEDYERMRVALADVRAKLNLIAHRTEIPTWAAEARACIRVIDRAAPRTVSSMEMP